MMMMLYLFLFKINIIFSGLKSVMKKHLLPEDKNNAQGVDVVTYKVHIWHINTF